MEPFLFCQVIENRTLQHIVGKLFENLFHTHIMVTSMGTNMETDTVFNSHILKKIDVWSTVHSAAIFISVILVTFTLKYSMPSDKKFVILQP